MQLAAKPSAKYYKKIEVASLNIWVESRTWTLGLWVMTWSWTDWIAFVSDLTQPIWKYKQQVSSIKYQALSISHQVLGINYQV